MKEAGLRFVDRVLGGALGLLRGSLIVAVVLDEHGCVHADVEWLEGSTLAPYFLVVGRAAIWVAPSELRARFYQGLDLLHRDTAAAEVAKRNLKIEKSAVDSFSKRKRDAVRDQLEALILQMYKSNILYSEAVREFKKRFILTVLQENNGNQCRAARQLGMHRNTLSRTISELKLTFGNCETGSNVLPAAPAPPPTRRKRFVESYLAVFPRSPINQGSLELLPCSISIFPHPRS